MLVLAMIIKLREGKCYYCDKIVKAPLVEPYEGKEEPTAMTLHSSEDYKDTYLGMICFDCAFSRMRANQLIIGYAGFPWSWEAVLV
jgi:hypothetical protein